MTRSLEPFARATCFSFDVVRVRPTFGVGRDDTITALSELGIAHPSTCRNPIFGGYFVMHISQQNRVNLPTMRVVIGSPKTSARVSLKSFR